MTWLSTLAGVLIVAGLVTWTLRFWRHREQRAQQGCFGCSGCASDGEPESSPCRRDCPCRCAAEEGGASREPERR